MNKIFYIFLLLIIATEISSARKIGGWDLSDEEIASMEQGLLRWKEIAAKAVMDRSPDMISELGIGIRKTSLSSIYVVGNRKEVNLLLRDAMLKIPGHSKYYANRINKEFAAYKGTALGDRKDGSGHTLQREMMWGYETMRQLPSPETVQVLGEMFKEEWHEPLGPGGDYRPPSLAVGAVNAMKILPFVEPPTPPFKDYDAQKNLPSWQKWYAEVKAGERSFAFIGQPVSYRFKPDGSVEIQQRNASNDPPLSPSRERKESQTTEQPAAKTRESSKLPWFFVGIVVVVLTAAGFFFRKKSKGQ